MKGKGKERVGEVCREVRSVPLALREKRSAGAGFRAINVELRTTERKKNEWGREEREEGVSASPFFLSAFKSSSGSAVHLCLWRVFLFLLLKKQQHLDPENTNKRRRRD